MRPGCRPSSTSAPPTRRVDSLPGSPSAAAPAAPPSGRRRAAGGPGGDLPARRLDHPRFRLRRFRSGDDGPRGHDLHSALARLRPLPAHRALPRLPERGSGALPGQGGRNTRQILSAASKGESPFVAHITIDKLFGCTGTIVAPTWVVTAGHCSSLSGVAVATPIEPARDQGRRGRRVRVDLPDRAIRVEKHLVAGVRLARVRDLRRSRLRRRAVAEAR